MNKKQVLGQYFSTSNVFNSEPLKVWTDTIPHWENRKILEPFAGGCDILNYFPNHEFSCYDIDPQMEGIEYRDSIKDFPGGSSVCITNPPYLAKNSVSRKGVDVTLKYADMYLDALEQCLEHCRWVAVIIPSTYIGLSQFKDRCIAIDKIDRVAFSDTQNPVCVAYFTQRETPTILTYVNGRRVYTNGHNTPTNTNTNIKFNVSDGNYVLTGIDSRKTNISISSDVGNFDRDKYLKGTSRNYVLFSADNLDVDRVNEYIKQWREETGDYYLSAFKSPVGDNEYYRKRISFNQLKWIINNAKTFI
jgi:hypothetical protein